MRGHSTGFDFRWCLCIAVWSYWLEHDVGAGDFLEVKHRVPTVRLVSLSQSQTDATMEHRQARRRTDLPPRGQRARAAPTPDLAGSSPLLPGGAVGVKGPADRAGAGTGLRMGGAEPDLGTCVRCATPTRTSVRRGAGVRFMSAVTCTAASIQGRRAASPSHW